MGEASDIARQAPPLPLVEESQSHSRTAKSILGTVCVGVCVRELKTCRHTIYQHISLPAYVYIEKHLKILACP